MISSVKTWGITMQKIAMLRCQYKQVVSYGLRHVACLHSGAIRQIQYRASQLLPAKSWTRPQEQSMFLRHTVPRGRHLQYYTTTAQQETTAEMETETTSIVERDVRDDGVERVCGGKCPGCGVYLQSESESEMGYIPIKKPSKRKYYEGKLIDEETLRLMALANPVHSLCRRCFSLKHYNKVIDADVANHNYKHHLNFLKDKDGLIVHVIDILDIQGSVHAGLHEIVGPRNPILLAINKADLLLGGVPDVPYTTKKTLEIIEAEIAGAGLKNVCGMVLVSARTKLGIEDLRKQMELLRRGRHVYLVGCTNVGKSSLINSLMQCFRGDLKKVGKSSAYSHEKYQQCTVSTFPGTTIAPLSFSLVPIIGDLDKNDGLLTQTTKEEKLPSKFFGQKEKHPLIHDTPGIFNRNQISQYLTQEELKLVLPTKNLKPRTFGIKAGQCLMFGAIARLDYLEGPPTTLFTVFASERLHIHATRTSQADEIYEKHSGVPSSSYFLTVPIGDAARLDRLPALDGTQYEFMGKSMKYSTCDIGFSTAGWIAVTCGIGHHVKVRALTLGGVGTYMRPSIHPFAVLQRGKKLKRIGRQHIYGLANHV